MVSLNIITPERKGWLLCIICCRLVSFMNPFPPPLAHGLSFCRFHVIPCWETRVVVRKCDVCEHDLGWRLLDWETVWVSEPDSRKLADLWTKWGDKDEQRINSTHRWPCTVCANVILSLYDCSWRKGHFSAPQLNDFSFNPSSFIGASTEVLQMFLEYILGLVLQQKEQVWILTISGEHRNVQSEELCCSISDVQLFAFYAELDELVGVVD